MNPGIGKNEQISCDGVCGLQQSPVALSVVEQSFLVSFYKGRESVSFQDDSYRTQETTRVYKENQCSS